MDCSTVLDPDFWHPQLARWEVKAPSCSEGKKSRDQPQLITWMQKQQRKLLLPLKTRNSWSFLIWHLINCFRGGGSARGKIKHFLPGEHEFPYQFLLKGNSPKMVLSTTTPSFSISIFLSHLQEELLQSCSSQSCEFIQSPITVLQKQHSEVVLRSLWVTPFSHLKGVTQDQVGRYSCGSIGNPSFSLRGALEPLFLLFSKLWNANTLPSLSVQHN